MQAAGTRPPRLLGDGTGNGGHSETTAEQLDGVLTADCGGYTIDVANALGFGEADIEAVAGRRRHGTRLLRPRSSPVHRKRSCSRKNGKGTIEMKKPLAVLLTAALAMSVFAALPAEAKKKKKKKKPVACAPYVPGELGAEAETLVVTDAATAEAPADACIHSGRALHRGPHRRPPTENLNVQVDSAGCDGRPLHHVRVRAASGLRSVREVAGWFRGRFLPRLPAADRGGC